MSHSSLWNFANLDSIWPLPHVILAYHAYLYTRNWISVLCFYYLIKVLQLLLFSLIGLRYEHFFAELLNSERGLQRVDTTGDFDCLVDFNGLFVGGTIQTFLGIFLGMTHAYLCAPSIYNVENFHPVTFWKSSATKHGKKFTKAKRFLNNNYDVRDIALRYGFWPWQLLFGLRPRSTTEPPNVVEKAFSPLLDWGKLDQEHANHAYHRWRFRRVFWVRWLQITFLGTPSLFFYTIESKNALRAGSILYGFITCSLLLWYKEVNQKVYLKHLLKKTAKDVEKKVVSNGEIQIRLDHAQTQSPAHSITFSLKGSLPQDDSGNARMVPRKCDSNVDMQLVLFNQNLAMTFNSYDVIYSVWIATCVALIAFQAIPLLTSFYRVIISSFSIILSSFIFAYIHNLLNILDGEHM